MAPMRRTSLMNQQLGNIQEPAGMLATNIENPRVGGSIPPQATRRFLSADKHLEKMAATNVVAVLRFIRSFCQFSGNRDGIPLRGLALHCGLPRGTSEICVLASPTGLASRGENGSPMQRHSCFWRTDQTASLTRSSTTRSCLMRSFTFFPTYPCVGTGPRDTHLPCVEVSHG